MKMIKGGCETQPRWELFRATKMKGNCEGLMFFIKPEWCLKGGLRKNSSVVFPIQKL